MYNLIMIFHVVLAFVIIIAIVMFQTSKGSALAMFGGGGDSLFNAASGTSFIKQFTMIAAGLFACTSLLLTVLGSSSRFHSVVQEYPLQAPPQQAAPAQPGAPAGKAGSPAAQPGALPPAAAPAPAAKAVPARK